MPILIFLFGFFVGFVACGILTVGMLKRKRLMTNNVIMDIKKMRAPIDMKPGDAVTIDNGEISSISRNGKAIWEKTE